MMMARISVRDLVLFALGARLVSAAPWNWISARQTQAVPSFVTDYAPLVYLHSQETYFPSDLLTHVQNTSPQINFKNISGVPSPLTLDNLDQLNNLGGANVDLTSNTDITKNPAWLGGVKPVDGLIGNAKSTVVVVNDRGSGNVDAFYFYFYSYNWGGVVQVLNQQLGNHVGDWEHNMIRFKNGVPQQMWFSQHSAGQAFTWDAVQKSGNRPIVFSANGSHANYAIVGLHDHTIPNLNLPINGILTDHTDSGYKWDPVSSAYFYSYTNGSSSPFAPLTLASSSQTSSSTTTAPSAPVGYLNFIGRWGDQQYPKTDPRQWELFGIDATAKYATGPTGPWDKKLTRKNVCPDGQECNVLPFLVARSVDGEER